MVTCPATTSSYKSEKKIADGKSEKLLREYYKRDERWEYEVRWLLDSRRDVTAVLEVLGNRGSKICAKKLNAFFCRITRRTVSSSQSKSFTSLIFSRSLCIPPRRLIFLFP